MQRCRSNHNLSMKSLISPYTLTLKLATRYYSTGLANRYVRFINRASRVGFALGVSALIIGLSLMNGFERELKSTLLSAIPHVEYESVTGHIEDWTQTTKQLVNHPQVTGVAPYLKLNAMLQKQNHMEAVLLKGVQPQLESSVNIIPFKIISGRWLNVPGSQSNLQKESQEREAVIGVSLAEKLDLKINSPIELLIPTFSDNGRLNAPSYLRFNIVGIYQVGGQVDTGQVFVDLSDLARSQNLAENKAHGVAVALLDPFDANKVAPQIGQMVTDYVYILDWFRSHGHVYNDIVLVKDIMYIVMVLVMAVASFNIVSSLSMAVQEKYGDIGILKTMGLSNKQVKQVFVLMGFLTALQGIAWGVFWGLVIAFNLTSIVSFIESALGVNALDGDVYFINYLPSQVQMGEVAIIAITAMVIAFLASLYPAKKASKLSPIELIQ